MLNTVKILLFIQADFLNRFVTSLSDQFLSNLFAFRNQEKTIMPEKKNNSLLKLLFTGRLKLL